MKKLRGVTLLETMLALAIATVIILLGIRLYTQYARDRDAFLLQHNVDILFQGLRNYYYANCAEKSNPNQTTGGKLAPSSQPRNPWGMDINAQFDGYLDSSFRPANPLVDSTFENSGYQAQFNNVSISNQRNENFCYFYPGTNQAQPNCASLPNASAIIYLWIAQIVVKIKDPTLALWLQGLTGADCAIPDYNGASIVDCAQATKPGKQSLVFLVWHRLPSFASPEMSSSLSTSTYNVKQFNLQYTNDSLWELQSTPYGGTSYYLCGG